MKEHFCSKFVFLLSDAKDEVKSYGKRVFATTVFSKGRCVRRGLVWYEIDVKMWVFLKGKVELAIPEHGLCH